MVELSREITTNFRMSLVEVSTPLLSGMERFIAGVEAREGSLDIKPRHLRQRLSKNQLIFTLTIPKRLRIFPELKNVFVVTHILSFSLNKEKFMFLGLPIKAS